MVNFASEQLPHRTECRGDSCHLPSTGTSLACYSYPPRLPRHKRVTAIALGTSVCKVASIMASTVEHLEQASVARKWQEDGEKIGVEKARRYGPAVELCRGAGKVAMLALMDRSLRGLAILSFEV